MQGKAGRVVNVASRMSELGTINTADPQLAGPGAFSSVRAYSQSKLCQVTPGLPACCCNDASLLLQS